MNWTEEIFEVRGADGLMRRGIVTLPERTTTDAAVVLLPAGLKDRVGPHRLYVRFARFFASHGVPVLRMDALGIGESDGEFGVAFNGAHYRRIQSGLFVDDTQLAMMGLTEKYAARRFILAGLCGGAITAQLTAASSNARVAGVLSFSHVAVLDEEGPVALRTRSEVVSNSRAYIRKIFSFDAWKRIFLGESSLRSIVSTVAELAYLSLEKAGLVRVRWANENPQFFSSFRCLQQAHIPQKMIFAERDARWTAFRELVVDGFLDGQLRGKGYDISVIAEANHEFYLSQWTQQLIQLSFQWVRSVLNLPRTFDVVADQGTGNEDDVVEGARAMNEEAGVPPSLMSHRIITSIEELEQWRDQWNNVEAQRISSSPFSSYLFSLCWWKHYAASNYELRVILVFDGDTLIGIAPIYLQTALYKLNVATLHLIGQGESEKEEVCAEYQDIIAIAGRETAVVNEVIEALCGLDEWSKFAAKDLLSDSLILKCLLSELKRRGMTTEFRETGQRYRIRLPATWSEYLSGLSQNHRRKINLARRRLAECGDGHISVVETADELPAAMQALAELHARRWAQRGLPGVFSSRRFMKFHQDWTQHLLRSNRLGLTTLSVNTQPIASLYKVLDGTTAYYYQSGANIEDWGRLSPGRVMLSAAIERAIEHGYKWFDFMRGSDESYKSNYGCETDPMYAVAVFRNNAGGRLAKKISSIKSRVSALAGRVK
ncbi:MAG: GNAT family N-acetyltransferase [Alcanivoracaceae bacterium]|nr:GNAT family N-acetyltransferase [Alcanivoracaceae bacterium]